MKYRWTYVLLVSLVLTTAPAYAFLEDLCLPRKSSDGKLSWCLQPTCPVEKPNRSCPQQTIQFVTIKPGRSMIHMDSTYFLAQALGYRADVAYWIAAYNEVTDYAQYVPIDQCGVQASNENAILHQTTLQTKPNSGHNYITAYYNGFQRTNTSTDGPLDHYVVSYSPNAQGTDVHGAGGVQSLYPLHYPQPGYPIHIDDVYQKTLANFRDWAMRGSSAPGVLCTVGLTNADDTGCLEGNINGRVPMIPKADFGVTIDVPAGRKVLNFPQKGNNVTYYEELESWLNDKKRTTGTLWKSPDAEPVPVQLARFGHYLHVLQDTSSHATYCGDDAPTPPGGGDDGTYMYEKSAGQYALSFGNSCANSPHLAGHVQETGTGDAPLPLRDYVALNNTFDELILFGNGIARARGWLANPELLPPDLPRGEPLKQLLVGRIVSGQPYSRAEVYESGIVTRPLQEKNSLDRLHAMNRALADYSEAVRKRSANPAAFVPFDQLPGNSTDPRDTSVCWK
ncbi:MAG TPA: hypothetical protein VJZ00_00015 [Thermoanaerobaculia bacterium]|nr:hypothetical protein [Thermoanaerobaculia bacterium]